MTVIILEGPEKAGKTTLTEALEKSLVGLGAKVVIRKQSGRADPDDSIYMDQLAVDTSKNAHELVAIWDRGWPSEFVYGTLLKQNRRLAKDPWLGEWLYGRMVQANGLRVMVTGPSGQVLVSLRDDTDLPVDPWQEKFLYENYAKMCGWFIIEQKPIEVMVTQIMNKLIDPLLSSGPFPPAYFGPPNAEIIVVSTKPSEKLGREFGTWAFNVGWATSHAVPPTYLTHAKILVVCDKKAELWVKHYIPKEGGEQQIVNIVGKNFHNVNQIISKLRKG